MDTIDCIKTRRSIRKFQKKEVSDEIIKDIIDCARHAPSGHDAQLWAFVVVKDKKKLELLSKAQKWSSFISNAPICIVVCCVPGPNNVKPSTYFSATCAAENIMLAAHSYGLGTCWCYVKDFDDSSVESRVKKILDIPKDIEVLCMIPVGYPDEKPEARKLKDYEEIVHNNSW